MKLFKSKKLIAVVATGAIVLGAAGGAYAYFTSTGSGTTVGGGHIGASSAVTVTGISVTGLKPGLTKPVSYSFTNTAGNGNQNFGVASASVSTILPVGCTATIAALSPTAASAAVGTVLDGATFNSSGTNQPSITMTENGNQDACQNATFDVTVTIAQGA